MADRNRRTPNSIPGRFYVDDTCVDCDICREVAPGTFRRDDAIGMSVAWSQPVTPEEITLAEEAVKSCPTDSVGNDG
jgi:ferredoxin